MKLVLRPLAHDDVSVLGLLEASDGRFVCFVVENAKMLIPAGTYEIAPHPKKHGNPPLDSLVLKGVKGRSYILLHVANRAIELLGCLAPNMGYFRSGTEFIGTGSHEAMTKVLALRATHITVNRG